MDVLTGAILVGLIIIGVIAQRISGLGFALMIAPFLAVLLGPHQGVMITNLFGSLTPILVLFHVWSRVDWRKFWQLCLPAVPATFLGIVLTAVLPAAPLNMVVGIFVIIGLSVAVLFQRRSQGVDNIGVRTGCGVLTGLTNSLAGVGGPSLTAYALISRWDPLIFAATIQPLFIVLGFLTFGVKMVYTPEQMPLLPLWVWVGCILAMLVGVWIGGRLEKKISPQLVRKFVIFIAFAGSAIAIVKGGLQLSGALS